ncbi:hypothetical protein [Terrabacter aerolatus]|uniref:hypothetical protein n=1 Tax=Terrabacter aerolatus TaxID=422442 RepID=UPI0011BE95D7|nr:hypothetical protein [Terrabacter aerolatus]
MSDSGFVDEASSEGDRPSRPRRALRRPAPTVVGFTAVVVGLLAFGGWAWSSRVHAADVGAYEALAREIEELDHTMTPLGHSEVPPCREATDGSLTRSYPPSTGPQAAELVGLLERSGWVRQDSDLPVYAHLTRTTDGHELVIDVLAPSDTSLVGSLAARSPASGFGCLLH